MVDKVTLEVIRSAAIYTSEEMGVVLRDTSFSPNIRDRLDHSCAVLDPEGSLVAQAEHIPVHLGSMSVAARGLIAYMEEVGLDLGPGDVVVSNDPYITGTHLNDVTVIKPVYHRDTLLGYVMNKAHHVDVGGPVPGSINPDARSLMEEGLVIEPVRIVESGRVRWDIVKMLEANVRTPRMLRGDLAAQIAALNVGEARLRELADRYGANVVVEAWGEVLDYTRRYTRALASRLPQGTYTAEDSIEASKGEAVLRATIITGPDGVTVDFTGTSPQLEEPFNAVYGVTVSATAYALKTVLDPGMPMNQGFLDVVRVEAPPGSMVNPRKPAPVGGGNVETSQRIVDVVHRALAKALPGRVPAASCGTMSNLILSGPGWAFYETIACGSGARPCCDGVDGVQTNMTNTLNTPVEVIEREYPLLVKRYELAPDTGGPGMYRGGLGVIREIMALQDGVEATILASRSQTRPWGLEGGLPGAPFKAVHHKHGGSAVDLPPRATVTLARGDTMEIRTPGGGGYGRPCMRSRELIERDLAEGRITPRGMEAYRC
ncbi:MAG: hydantoinase B/oxoprolinase family protein [Desulfurococcales archaeon]|nr:hydantoinase B/oxoprolinase family protein [Desulfurococcales archaeon]